MTGYVNNKYSQVQSHISTHVFN